MPEENIIAAKVWQLDGVVTEMGKRQDRHEIATAQKLASIEATQVAMDSKLDTIIVALARKDGASVSTKFIFHAIVAVITTLVSTGAALFGVHAVRG